MIGLLENSYPDDAEIVRQHCSKEGKRIKEVEVQLGNRITENRGAESAIDLATLTDAEEQVYGKDPRAIFTVLMLQRHAQTHTSSAIFDELAKIDGDQIVPVDAAHSTPPSNHTPPSNRTTAYVLSRFFSAIRLIRPGISEHYGLFFHTLVLPLLDQ